MSSLMVTSAEEVIHEPARAQFEVFDALSYSNRRRYVMAIEGAKTAETRVRRVSKAVADLLT